MKAVRRLVALALCIVVLMLLAPNLNLLLAQGQNIPKRAGKNPAGQSFILEPLLQAAPPQGEPARARRRLHPVSPQELDKLKEEAVTSQAPEVAPLDSGESTTREIPNAPPLVYSYAGFNGSLVAPPDPAMAAGPTFNVITVNTALGIQSKPGAPIGYITLQDLFRPLLPQRGNGFVLFDPEVIYDSLAGRFLLTVAAQRESDKKSFVLIAASRSNDPRMGWCGWASDFTLYGNAVNNVWADYPKVGVNKDAVFITANMFNWSDKFKHAKLRIIPKAALYDAACPGWGWWDLKFPYFTLQPALTFNSRPEYIAWSSYAQASFLVLWRIRHPNSAPELTRYTVPVTKYNLPPNAQQLGGGVRVDTGDATVQNLLVTGNYAWTAHTVACKIGGDTQTRACVRWYQIRLFDKKTAQQQTYGRPGYYYFFPAIMADANQNAVMVFSSTSAENYVGIRYTGRNSGDIPGLMQSSRVLRPGFSHYVVLDDEGENRWGDYGGIALDPLTGCFWMHHEYASGTEDVWGTWVGNTCFR